MMEERSDNIKHFLFQHSMFLKIVLTYDEFGDRIALEGSDC